MDTNKPSYRSVLQITATYEELFECIHAAIFAFAHRVNERFVILRNWKLCKWHVMPWADWRTIRHDNPAINSVICFDGNLATLRELAMSFPPDLFSDTPPRPEELHPPTPEQEPQPQVNPPLPNDPIEPPQTNLPLEQS